MAETKKDDPTVFDTNDELRECLKLEKTSPTVDGINELWRSTLMDLRSKQNMKDQANFERNLDVAIHFIQKLHLTGIIFPEPAYKCSSQGSIKFEWNHPDYIGSVLGCIIIHAGDTPVIAMGCGHDKENAYKIFEFSTEQEQAEVIETAVRLLKPISVVYPK